MQQLNCYECYIRTHNYGGKLKVCGDASCMADFIENVEQGGNKIISAIKFKDDINKK